MKNIEMIWFIGSRIDMDHWIKVCRGPLDAEYTWKEVIISLTENSKEGGSLTFKVSEIAI